MGSQRMTGINQFRRVLALLSVAVVFACSGVLAWGGVTPAAAEGPVKVDINALSTPGVNIEYIPTELENGDFEAPPWVVINDHRWYTTETGWITTYLMRNTGLGEALVKNMAQSHFEWAIARGTVDASKWPEEKVRTPETVNNVSDYVRKASENYGMNYSDGAFVEMNANVPAILYQDEQTTPGDILFWRLLHGKRKTPETQSIEVQIGRANGTPNGTDPKISSDGLARYDYTGIQEGAGKVAFAKESELVNLTISTRDAENTSAAGVASYLKDDGNIDVELSNARTVRAIVGTSYKNVLINNKDKSLFRQWVIGTGNTGSWGPDWYGAAGVYIVPADQITTRFAFISTTPGDSNAKSLGNMLDDIVFETLLGNVKLKVDDDKIIITGYWSKDPEANKYDDFAEYKIKDTNGNTMVQGKIDMTEIRKPQNDPSQWTTDFTAEIPIDTTVLPAGEYSVEVNHGNYPDAKTSTTFRICNVTFTDTVSSPASTLPVTQRVLPGHTVDNTVNNIAPVKEGYTFSGWVKKGETEPYDFTLPVNSDIELQAKWEKNGSLVVTNTVAGNGGDKTKYFDYTVTLSDTSINGTYNGVKFTNGVSETFQLKHGESITFANLPAGIAYTVTEANYTSEGYDTQPTMYQGHIPSGEHAGGTVTASFLNTRNIGALTISKEVEGNAANRTKEFTFEIELSRNGTPVNGTHSGYQFTNGKATFTLKDDEKIIFNDLLDGTSYVVRETDGTGYVTTVNGTKATSVTNTINTNLSRVAEFVNTRNTYGQLEVKNTVGGNAGEKGKDFHFTVVLGDESINGQIPGDTSGLVFTHGVATFTLKHNETKLITNLPNGISYKVIESDYEPEGYATTPGNEVEGHITGNDAGTSKATVQFTNTRNAGALTISKALAGNDVEHQKDFTFTILVKLNNQSISGTYSGVEFTSGEGTVYLKGGEGKEIFGLPNGTKYTVTEVEANQNQYQTSVEGGEGTIRENASAVAKFINTRNTYGDLIVNHFVGGKGDTKKEFVYTVQLSDETITGTYGGMTFVDGVARFALTGEAGKNTIKAEDLPNGIGYTVTVLDYTGDGYMTTHDGTPGTIVGGDEEDANFYHTRNTGVLTVTNDLEGNAADHSKEFNYTITLDKKVNGEYSGIQFTDGVGHFVLKHDEDKEIVLEDGMGYVVTQQDYTADGYVTVSKDTAGTFNKDKAMVAEFINTRNTYGSLKVTNRVMGNGGDVNKKFVYSVILTDTTINGTYGGMHFEDGVATFELDGNTNSSMTATGLPNGVEYTVSYPDIYADEGYVTEEEDPTGAIVGGEEMLAEFLHIRNIGTLTVSKILHGNDVEHSRDFTFTIHITLDNKRINGVYSDVAFVNGEATIQLKGGEYKEIFGLPQNTHYTVSEADYSREGYVTVSHDTAGIIDQNSAEVAEFINTRDTFGSLQVTKVIEGEGKETDRQFHFTVELSDKAINGTHGGMHFANGVAGFYLVGGESVTADMLPNGTHYKVTEHDYVDQGYETESVNAEGHIVGKKTVEAKFTNVRHEPQSLTVYKRVEGNAASANDEFTFTVTFDRAINSASVPTGVTKVNDKTYTFTLTHGHEMVFHHLEVGTHFTVTESHASGTPAADYDEHIIKDEVGHIQKNNPAVAEFVSVRNRTGSLTVEKKVEGGSVQHEFFFIVELDDHSINGTYGQMHFADGVTEFALTGEAGKNKMTAAGLPNGIRYTVTELHDPESNYAVSIIPTIGSNGTSHTGVIEGGKDAQGKEINQTVIFTNKLVERQFIFTKLWQGGHEDSISWKLYKNGNPIDAAFTKTVISQNEWRYTANLDAEGEYYLVENVPAGYSASYTNSGAHAAATDRCYNGGVITNAKVPPQTGDNAHPVLWSVLLLLSLAGVTAGLVSRKRKA